MPKRRYETRSTAAAKRANIDPPLPQLPQEMLEKIFLNLKVTELLQARQTCHRWRDTIAGCPGLRDKLWLKFPHDPKITKINRNYKPPGTVPASNVEFKLTNYSKIGSTDAWWPQVASTVTCLVITGCEFPVDMLRYAPNLKTLKLDYASVVGSAKVDFKMDNLRKLSLTESNPGQLSRMITRLEVLDCWTEDDDWESLCSIVELIKSVHLTLTELNVEVPERYLQKFAQLRELRLKQVYIDGYEREVEMIPFVQAHPSIEDLTIVNSIDDDALRNTLQAPTNLKRLKLKYSLFNDEYSDVFPVIPNVLSNLECLQIECAPDSECQRLNLERGCQFPKLKELCIESVILEGQSLCKALRYSPNLHTLTLKNCEFESWNQLVRLIAQPKELRSLTINLSVEFKRIDPDQISTKPCKSLRYLRIGADLENAPTLAPTTKIASLLRVFPHLTELYLDFGVDDELVKEACQTLTRLERLTMCAGSTTHHHQQAIDYIRHYCRNLKHLKLIGFWEINVEDLNYFDQNLDRFSYERKYWRLLKLISLIPNFLPDRDSDSDLF